MTSDLQPAEQLLLSCPDLDEAAFFADPDSERGKRYAKCSGTTVERRAAVCALLREMLAAGCSERHAASVAKVSRQAVHALRTRWEASGELAPVKERLASQCERFATLALDRMIEAAEAGEIDPEKLPVATGILIDKALLLRGQATAVVEHRRTEPTLADVGAYIASLPAANATEVVQMQVQIPDAPEKGTGIQ